MDVQARTTLSVAAGLEAVSSCGHFTSVATAVFTLMEGGRLIIVEVPTPVSENKTVCYAMILIERHAIVPCHHWKNI